MVISDNLQKILDKLREQKYDKGDDYSYTIEEYKSTIDIKFDIKYKDEETFQEHEAVNKFVLSIEDYYGLTVKIGIRQFWISTLPKELCKIGKVKIEDILYYIEHKEDFIQKCLKYLECVIENKNKLKKELLEDGN